MRNLLAWGGKHPPPPPGRNTVKVTGIVDPSPLSKTEVHLKISEHKMLSVRRGVIENNDSWVVISLSKVSEKSFLKVHGQFTKWNHHMAIIKECLNYGKIKGTICIFLCVS